MSCLRSKWCPECREVIWDPICMCLGGCDKHRSAICTTVVPDGRHPYREKGKSQAASEVEYRNGWEVGHMGWPPGHDWKNPPIWCVREPGHPTKSPQQIQSDEFTEKMRGQPRFLMTLIQEEIASDGGGI